MYLATPMKKVLLLAAIVLIVSFLGSRVPEAQRFRATDTREQVDRLSG